MYTSVYQYTLFMGICQYPEVSDIVGGREVWVVSPQFPPAEGVQNFWTHPDTSKSKKL